MSRRARLSAVIITLNAERHLKHVLAALAFCDEIVVLDSGSQDRTLELARQAKASIHAQAFLGFGRQKQRAVELARNDWVLVVDADEVLDAVAKAAIEGLDFSDPRRAWRVRRRSYVGGREVRHGVWSPDRSLRLFHREHARFNDVPVHESVVTSGQVLDLPGSLAHYSFRDYADVFARMGAYSRAKAGIYRSRGRRCGPLRLMLRMSWGFLRSYIFKLGVLDGNAGVVVALSLAVDSVVAMALASEVESTTGSELPPASAPSQSGKRRGMKRVIINFARVGDMVLMIPALRLLSEGAELELVGRPWAQAVLGGQPWLKRIHTISHPYRGHGLHDAWLYGGVLRQLADSLQREGFDEILVFKQESPKIMRWMRSWAGTSTVRILDSGIRPGGSPHPVDIYRDALGEAGFDVSRFDPRPQLSVDPEMGARMASRVDALGSKVISLQSGSSLINRWWWKRRPNLRGLTTAQWASLLSRLLREGDADAIILHGAPREGPQARAIRDAMPVELRGKVHDWTGRAPLEQLPGIFARVRAILTVDTGPAHIAAAVGCPALVVFGPSDPRRWQPRGPGPVEALLGSAPCQFCNETPLIKKCRNNICLNRLSDEFIHSAWRRLRSRLPVVDPAPMPTVPPASSP